MILVLAQAGSAGAAGDSCQRSCRKKDSKKQTERNTHTHTHAHTHRERQGERDGDRFLHGETKGYAEQVVQVRAGGERAVGLYFSRTGERRQLLPLCQHSVRTKLVGRHRIPLFIDAVEHSSIGMERHVPWTGLAAISILIFAVSDGVGGIDRCDFADAEWAQRWCAQRWPER